METERATLEHRIFNMIRKSNENTPHFNYKVNFEKGSITLDLYTFNPLQNNIHFLHTVTENTPVLCLTKMVIYLENYVEVKKEMKPYTITWNIKGETIVHDSYYYEESENHAVEKFFIGKDVKKYDFTVKLNPLS